ncbi:MAG: tol-pal system YbgF family protein [Sandaracinaceae bacterium]
MTTPPERDLESLFVLDEHAGPARRLSQSQREALVGAALDAWEGSATPAQPKPAPVSVTVPWARVAGVAAAIGAAFVAGGAALAFWLAQPEPAPPPPPSPAPAPVPARSLLDEAPAPSTPTLSLEDLRGEAPHAEDQDLAPIAPAPRDTASADDWLQRANQLRSARRWADAEQAYLVASRRHPSSQTAYVANIAAADIRLHHRGRASGAAALYRRALAQQPDGPLSLEARQGLALAYRALGSDDREARALDDLIRRHPASRARERAQARLNELRPPTP